MIQINANVSGFDPASDAVPSLMNDSGRLAAWLFDPNNLTRGHWELPDYSPANGWTLRWADQALRVWLSLDETHQPLPPGAYELALLHGDANQPMPAVLAYAPPTLSPVIANGLDLTVDGQRWVYRGATHFLAILRMELGGLAAVVDYDGSNAYRVFGTNVNIAGQAGLPPLDPERVGRSHYLDIVRALSDEFTTRRRYFHLCALADIAALGRDRAWARTLVFDLLHALRDKTNVLFSVGNEPWNPVNGWRYDWFAAAEIAAVWPYYFSMGSIADEAGDYGYDGLGITGRVVEVHPRRDLPKFLAHQALSVPWWQLQKALVVDESVKFNAVVIDGKQYNDPRFARVVSQEGRAVCGIGFHSPEGCFSISLEPQTDACRSAFFEVEL